MRRTSWMAEDPLAGIRMEADEDADDLEEGGPPPDEDEEDDQDQDQDDDEDETLGEAGKKALQRERAARKQAERDLKTLQTENENESEKRLREATEEVERKYHGLIARSAFRAALAEAGLQKGQQKLMKLLDLEDVTVDEDGEVEGVDAQVDALKKDFPELFSRTPKGGGKGDGGAGKGAPPKKEKTSAELLAERAGIGG